MSAKKIALKTIKWGIILTLALGAAAALGLLSYCGMLVIAPSITFACMAFGFSLAVEGEVYLQNVRSGVDNLKLLGPRGLDALITKTLDQALKQQPDDTADPLLKAYYEHRKYVASFIHKKLNQKQKEERKQAIKRLHRMQKILVARVLSTKNDSDETILTIRKQLPALKRKIWFLRFSIPVCLGAGSAFGFATASALVSALLSLGIVASAAIWPLAVVACIGYAFLIYHTLSDMVCSETFAKWREKFAYWFKPELQKDEKGEVILDKDGNPKKIINAKYIWRIIGTSGLLALTFTLGILATLATAGTWWLAVKNGALLLSIFAPAANVIRNIFVPIASAATLIFTLRNSLTTVKQMVKDIRTKHPINYLKEKYRSLIETETQDKSKKHNLGTILNKQKEKYAPGKNWASVLNPFRILAAIIRAPFLLLVFMGHLASVGLTGDRAPGLNYTGMIFSAIFGALSDGLVDYHYIMGHKHEVKPHKLDETHHTHGFIANLLLKFLIWPLLVASAAWDVVASKNEIGNLGLNYRERSLKALKANFGIKEHQGTPDPEPQSTIFLNEEMKYRFEKQKKRLANSIIDKELAADKIVALDKIQEKLFENPKADISTYKDILKKPRTILFAKSKCTTERVVEEVIAQYERTITVK